MLIIISLKYKNWIDLMKVIKIIIIEIMNK